MRILLALAVVLAFFPSGIATAATVTVVNGVEIISGQDPPAQARLVRKHARSIHPSAPKTERRKTKLAEAVVRGALAYVGTPYRWGGTSPTTGFDCSGYVQFVFAGAGVRIPRTADAQFAFGRPVAGYPVPGDLVFFQTYDWGASHVGIYLGDGWFVQEIAPNVHLSNFNSPYFRTRYIGARRYLT